MKTEWQYVIFEKYITWKTIDWEKNQVDWDIISTNVQNRCPWINGFQTSQSRNQTNSHVQINPLSRDLSRVKNSQPVDAANLKNVPPFRLVSKTLRSRAHDRNLRLGPYINVIFLQSHLSDDQLMKSRKVAPAFVAFPRRIRCFFDLSRPDAAYCDGDTCQGRQLVLGRRR